jgi:hypothetical protein
MAIAMVLARTASLRFRATGSAVEMQMSGPGRRSRRCPYHQQPAEIGPSVLGSTVKPQHVEEQRAEDDEIGSGLGRLLAFSDSVFAVSITLLVFDLSVRSGLT